MRKHVSPCMYEIYWLFLRIKTFTGKLHLCSKLSFISTTSKIVKYFGVIYPFKVWCPLKDYAYLIHLQVSSFSKLKVSTFYAILKVQLFRIYNTKYMIASTQITNTEVLIFIAVLVYTSLSRRVLFINKKDNRNC